MGGSVAQMSKHVAHVPNNSSYSIFIVSRHDTGSSEVRIRLHDSADANTLC